MRIKFDAQSGKATLELEAEETAALAAVTRNQEPIVPAFKEQLGNLLDDFEESIGNGVTTWIEPA